MPTSRESAWALSTLHPERGPSTRVSLPRTADSQTPRTYAVHDRRGGSAARWSGASAANAPATTVRPRRFRETPFALRPSTAGAHTPEQGRAHTAGLGDLSSRGFPSFHAQPRPADADSMGGRCGPGQDHTRPGDTLPRT